MSGKVEVAFTDIMKLILQFLKENNYLKSLKLLQKESHVSFNGLSNIDVLLSDIKNGKWNNVLETIYTMELSEPLLFLIYEQIVLELVELREYDLANSLLTTSIPLQIMSSRESIRYSRLVEICKTQNFNCKELFNSDMPSFKRKRRAEISTKIATEIDVVSPSRLIEIIGMAIKWQQHQHLIPDSSTFNLFSGKITSSAKTNLLTLSKIIKVRFSMNKFAEKSYPECAIFTPNGKHLVTGSSDGYIEVWDYITGKLDLDLVYQKEDRIMTHDCLVMSLAISSDSQILSSGDKKGNVKVWNLTTGECVKKFNQVHSGPIISITFSPDSLNLLTGSFDHTARIHGLKSGTTLKEFRGHKSFVNVALYNFKGNKVITGSSDGYIKVWEVKTAQCLISFAPPEYSVDNILISAEDRTVLKPITGLFFSKEEHLWVSSGQRVVFLMDLGGNVLKKLSVDDSILDDEFNVSCISNDGDWIYSLSNKDCIYSLSTVTSDYNFVSNVHSSQGIGLVHHPSQPLLISFGSDSNMKIFNHT